MRAAFIAVQDGRQVAVLVPTTLLAQQHYQNFRDRFADWPVRIEVLSRFRTGKQQEAILAGLADGIGRSSSSARTSCCRSRSGSRDLGLVIIDEEHRFGVRQKERLKALRAEVDILTLTATPDSAHPEHGACPGCATCPSSPPRRAHRLAVKTFVCEWNDAAIHEACLREIKRGGQIYFLHNEVETIERIAGEIARTGARGGYRGRPRPDARARTGAGHAGFLSPALQPAGVHHHHRERHRRTDRQYHHHRTARTSWGWPNCTSCAGASDARTTGPMPI